MNSTSGKTVVLTGATRGLGLAMADKLIALGHTVLGCGRTRSLVEKLRLAHGPPHDFAVVDVAQDGQVKAWADRLLAGYPAPDLLLNNAALINHPAPLWQVPAEEFDHVIDVNIKGVTNVLRHFVPAMLARQRGVIVNFSSGWGRSTSPEVAPYCATKWAVEGLTRSLAQELPRGLAAVPLNPGIIDTDMLRGCWAEDAGGYPTAREWAETAVPFLLRLNGKDNGKPLTVPR
jgi:NAD(P)-dependent dehydrogenase (short-subunit alcohol dehydrogenase family)